MRKKRFIWNMMSSLGGQIVSLVCGFILPRMILNAFGTQINGLVSSITQFLTVVSLTEFGMTAVVQSSLYEALAENDNTKISKILTSSSHFFRKIAVVLMLYVITLGMLYPVLIHTNYDYWFVFTLVIILSINSIGQYLLGITNDQLISADQHAYILSITSMLTTMLNTAACYLVIKIGAGIHVVKLITASIFLLRPFVSAIYVKMHYCVNKHTKYDHEPIQQKWNGVSQHIAYYVFSSTDVIVLSLFSTLENVSIYSVYSLVLNGLKQICSLFENGIKPLFGEAWARKDQKRLRTYFSMYEIIMHMGSIFVFGCASSLIVPFVRVYTRGINDANYMASTFSLIITVAYAVLNIKNPYNTLIQAVGHYKQTQHNYVTVACINIFISVAMVYKFGLVGVAVGTLISAGYQVIWQANYLYKTILNFPALRIVKFLQCDVFCFVLGKMVTSLLPSQVDSYFQWIVMAIPSAVIWIVIVLSMSALFYWNDLNQLKRIVMRNRRARK